MSNGNVLKWVYGKTLLTLLLVFAVIIMPASQTWANGTEKVTSNVTAVPVDVSIDGRYVLVTNDSFNGLVLVNKETGKNTVITDGKNAGYYATISPDNQFVCFKSFKPSKEGFLQKAMLYDIEQNKLISLCGWDNQVGTPAIANDGTIAFTQGNKLLFLNKQRKMIKEIDLGQYINLISFSPDSSQIAYCNENQQVVLLNHVNKQKVAITSEQGAWGPKFSPKGDKLLVNTVNGNVGYTAVQNGKVQIVGKGQALGWSDNETFVYLEKTINEQNSVVTKTSLVLYKIGENAKQKIDINQSDAYAAVKGTKTALVRSGELECGDIGAKNFTASKKLDLPESVKRNSITENAANETDTGEAAFLEKNSDSAKAVVEATRVYLSGVPYIHQVYDTAENFNGNSACNATAALMAIQYYKVLPAHPITVSVPSKHTSNYGWYVSNVYTKGRTFDIYSKAPSGKSFAGGFGYITQNNWQDTKGHMAEYIRYHGRSSSVDWSPTWAELQTDINNNHPFVVLTSLTSAGHYITAIGYLKNQHTAIFNDPYGNKNKGYKNYQGAFSYYDWPGYNNGYQNLNTVHCFIYAR